MGDEIPKHEENSALNDVQPLKDSLPKKKTASEKKTPAGDHVDSGDPSADAGSSSRQQTNAAAKPVSQAHPELMRIMQEASRRAASGSGSASEDKKHQFWSTQPMPQYAERIPEEVNEPVEVKTVDEVQKEPYGLPADYYWDTLDISHPETLEELYNLLHDNYVEDDDAMFRFRYAHEFLLWALKPPGWRQEWHLGVRVNAVGGSNKLVGFISAVPSHIRIRGKAMPMTEVNFLCVHKKLRSKRMAVILIKEITRRCNVRGIFQAVYTAGAVLPKPLSTCRYWHRSLNPQKLVEVQFSSIGKNMTMQRMKKLYKLPDQTKTPGFRPAEGKDVAGIHQLLTAYLCKFGFAPEFTIEEVAHYFVPKDKVIYAFVVENEKGQLTDFASFYSLPSTVVRGGEGSAAHKHDSVNAAYSFYNVAAHTSWTNLMMDVIIMAKKLGFDVFNALDLMDNKQFISELKFGIGDGNLNYYIYNWKCSQLAAEQIGLVLM